MVSSSSSGNVTPGARTEGAQLVASYTFAAGYALGAGWEHIDNVDPTTHNSHWNNFVLSGNVWLTPKLELQGLYSQSHDILGVSGLTGQQYSLALVDYLSKKNAGLSIWRDVAQWWRNHRTAICFPECIGLFGGA